jgi:hypothetical protein
MADHSGILVLLTTIKRRFSGNSPVGWAAPSRDRFGEAASPGAGATTRLGVHADTGIEQRTDQSCGPVRSA